MPNADDNTGGVSRASGRSGRYIRQPAGYSAFFPASLPPDPPVEIDGPLQRMLSSADLALGRLDGSIQILPDPDLFVYMYVRKEAVLSSQIEGTQSSLQDLLAAEASIFSTDRPQDVAEVVNYVAAMNHGIERLETLPVSVRLIREIHERLLIEHDKALAGVIVALMKDDTELFKQFSDNPEFKRWLTDTIFSATYDRPTPPAR